MLNLPPLWQKYFVLGKEMNNDASMNSEYARIKGNFEVYEDDCGILTVMTHNLSNVSITSLVQF